MCSSFTLEWRHDRSASPQSPPGPARSAPPAERSVSAAADRGIEVEGLVREFKDTVAVAGIDLRVEPGEIYGFLGPNGAGKSTTVLMLTTLLPPTRGSARVAGHD